MENRSQSEDDFQSQFVDYTNATSFEYFISSIENVIDKWNLENKGHIPHTVLNSLSTCATDTTESDERPCACTKCIALPVHTFDSNTNAKYELLPIETTSRATDTPLSVPFAANASTPHSCYLMILCGSDEHNFQSNNEMSHRKWRVGMEHFTPTMLSIANSDRDSPNVLENGQNASSYTNGWSEYRMDEDEDAETRPHEWNTEVTWHPQQLNQMLCRWFGVSEAILILRVTYSCGISDSGRASNSIILQGFCSSQSNVNGLDDQLLHAKVEEMDGDEAKYILSSLTLALDHRNCTLPFFVPVNDLKEGNWLGGSIPGSYGTTSLTFETQRVQEVWFPQSCISGLLDYFKSKLQLPIDTAHNDAFERSKGCLEPGIRVSAWYKYQWFPSTPTERDGIKSSDAFPWRTSALLTRHSASRRRRKELLKLLFGKKSISEDTPYWGCCRFPIKRMDLVVAWKNLREGTFVDNAVHSTLNPVDAPEWFLRATFHSFRAINERKPEMPLSKLLANLTQAYSNARELGKDLLVTELSPPLHRASSWMSRITDDATNGSKQELNHSGSTSDTVEKALKMTSQTSRSFHDSIPAARAAVVFGNAIGSLTSSIMAAATWKGTDIKIIQEVIQDLFSTSMTSTGHQESSTLSSSSMNLQDDNDETFDARCATSSEPQSFVSEFDVSWISHTAPPDTLTSALACRMGMLHGVTAMSLLWVEFVSRLRDCWSEYRLVPHLGIDSAWNEPSEGAKRSSLWLNGIRSHEQMQSMEMAFAPDFRCCLLHQKLQLLNGCILRRAVQIRDPERYHSKENGSTVNLGEEGSRSEDEYFDTIEHLHDELYIAPSNPLNQKPRGVLTASKHQLKLLLTGATMNEPILQAALPLTEDIAQQHEEILTRLGGTSESVRLRQEMQSATLVSDMQAFKAANPGAVLADFIRWYTPKDWTSFEQGFSVSTATEESNMVLSVEESSLPLTGKDKWWFSGKGMLSQRTRPIDDLDSNVTRNLWQDMWEKCCPKPVAEQKALFTPDHEAEKVFHYLETIRPVEMFHQMLVAAMGGCVYTLLTVFDTPSAVHSDGKKWNTGSNKRDSLDKKIDALPAYIGTHMRKVVDVSDRAVSLLDEALTESQQLNQPIRQAGSILTAAMEMALDACWNVVKVVEDVELLMSEALSLLNYLTSPIYRERKSSDCELIKYWDMVDSMLQSSHNCVFPLPKKHNMTAVHSHSTIRTHISTLYQFPTAPNSYASSNFSDTSDSVPQLTEPIQREYVLRSICCRSFLQENNVNIHRVNRWQAHRELEEREENNFVSKLETTSAQLLANSAYKLDESIDFGERLEKACDGKLHSSAAYREECLRGDIAGFHVDSATSKVVFCTLLVEVSDMQGMTSPYAKTVGGKLRLKGNATALSKKRKRSRKSEQVEPKLEDDNSQIDQPSAEDLLTKCKGTGRILSSGTTLMGQIGTKFLQELSVGDAIIIQHPTSLVEETRILRMVLSDVSASLSSPFSTDLISSTAFHYIKAPKDDDEQENESTLKKRILKSDEKNAFGTYAGGTEMGTELTYRVKKSGVYGGYQIIREKASAVRTREELLDFREKKKGDRHCM